jgi:GntR family carbon starvation induced transcriptional regulator
MNYGVSLASEVAPQRDGTQTRAELAFVQIRNDIIRGRLAPNMRLRLEELRERYDMGFSPLREALTRLQSDGLVVLEQMKGFRVSPVSLDHLHDITRVRIEVENMCLRWAIDQGDVDWEANIIGTFHMLSKQSKSVPGEPSTINESWNQFHRAFHGALISACGSPVLMSISDALFDQAERYVAVSIRYLAQQRDDVSEHRQIMETVISRNAEKACKLNKEHIERTTTKVVASSEIFDEVNIREKSR